MAKNKAGDVKNDAPAGTPTVGPSSTLGSDESSDRPKKARRTFLTQNACTRCRQKKSKCDGKRPRCGRCEKHSAECTYDVAQEGVTRMQNLQNQLDTKSEDYSRLMQLFSALQQGSDHVATTILARLRLGESLENLIAMIEKIEQEEVQQGEQIKRDNQRNGEYLRSWPISPSDGSWPSRDAQNPPASGTISSKSTESGVSRMEIVDQSSSRNPVRTDRIMVDGARDQYHGSGGNEDAPYEDEDAIGSPTSTSAPGPYYCDTGYTSRDNYYGQLPYGQERSTQQNVLPSVQSWHQWHANVGEVDGDQGSESQDWAGHPPR